MKWASLTIASAFLLATQAFAARAADQADPTYWLPDRKMVESLEPQVKMPQYANPVGDYTRTYFGNTTPDGHRVIHAAFVLGGDRHLHLTDRPDPVPDDAYGKYCSVVVFSYVIEYKYFWNVVCAAQPVPIAEPPLRER
jgi:hypothetical protein